MSNISQKMSIDVAGTWGSEKIRELRMANDSDSYVTVSKETFSGKAVSEKLEKLSGSPAAKYGAMKKQTSSLMSYGESLPESISNQITRTATQIITNCATYEYNYSEDASLSPKKLYTRTESKFLTSEEAPLAKGRSGPRIEKGVSTSGLLGEKLNLSPEPSKNSFVQKSWLYGQDPALHFKVNGYPDAFMPNDVSLPIGLTSKSHEGYKEGYSYGRKAVLTGDPLSKAGAKRAGVFMDDFPA